MASAIIREIPSAPPMPARTTDPSAPPMHTMTNNNIPIEIIIEQFNLPESKVQDLLIQLAEILLKQKEKYPECPICMEDTHFKDNLSKMPVQTPCCRQYLCKNCVKSGIDVINDNKVFQCYFCRRHCVISKQLSKYF
jgi:hypothetical protein